MAYLVGAGPGRADLITLRGAELIKIADCLIVDKLANPALLEMARKDAEIIHVPKRIGPGSFTQDQINQILVEKALAGKIVVRLKGGDPCIFGRCTEEAALLNEAGVDFEIVPGITAAIAAAEYTGIMLTDRRYSSQVAFITGREAEGKEDSNIDWNVLAHFPGTLVFYMGIGTLPTISRATDGQWPVRRHAGGARRQRHPARPRRSCARPLRRDRRDVQPGADRAAGPDHRRPGGPGRGRPELVHAKAAVRPDHRRDAGRRRQRRDGAEDHRTGRSARWSSPRWPSSR